MWNRGRLIHRALVSRGVLGGTGFQVVDRMMCWVRICRCRMWLRLRGLRVARAGCLRWGMWMDRLRVEEVGASGGVWMVRVMRVRSLRGRLVLVLPGRVRGSGGRARSWRRCGRSCVVLVMPVSRTPVSRWARSSGRVRRGVLRGLRSSLSGRGV